MPNHITNRLTINGTDEQVKEVLDFLKSKTTDEEGYRRAIDFNNIIPMPEELANTTESNRPDDEAKMAENKKKYGYRSWYDWSLDKWGTKWNAYDIDQYDNVVIFHTAWAGVPELMSKLAQMFPKVSFDYAFADEDVSYNVGMFEFNGDELIETPIENGSREAYELCFELGVADPDDFELVDGNYEWIDSED